MNRLRLVSVIVGLVVALAGPTAAAAAPPGNAFGEWVRFDVPRIVHDTVLAGGSAVARDAATGDTQTVTATGVSNPGGTGLAVGFGTFSHRHANGSLVASGVWIARSVVSWRPAGGTLAGLGLTDGIGDIHTTSAGVLLLNVTLFPFGGSPKPGVLGIHCQLPGSSDPSIEEGVSLDVGPFHFEPVEEGGLTVFHIFG